MALNVRSIVNAMARGKLVTSDLLRDDEPDIMVLPTTKGHTMSYGREIRPCGCECSRGGFCGGCGHAGCGGRR